MERLTRPDGSPVPFLGQPQTDAQAEDLIVPQDGGTALDAYALGRYRAARRFGVLIDVALDYALLSKVGHVSKPWNDGGEA